MLKQLLIKYTKYERCGKFINLLFLVYILFYVLYETKNS